MADYLLKRAELRYETLVEYVSSSSTPVTIQARVASLAIVDRRVLKSPVENGTIDEAFDGVRLFGKSRKNPKRILVPDSQFYDQNAGIYVNGISDEDIEELAKACEAEGLSLAQAYKNLKEVLCKEVSAWDRRFLKAELV